MTASTRTTPLHPSGVMTSRAIVATDWSSPRHVIAAMRAFSQLWHPRTTMELVVAVPSDPTQDDVQRVTRLIEANPAPVNGPVTIESFAEALASPFDAALVPEGDADATLVKTADFVARLGQLTTALGRVSNTGNPDDLRVELGNFKETGFTAASTGASPENCSGPHWYGTYIGDGRVLASLRTGGRVYLPADNRATTPNVMHTGVFEPELHAYVRSIVPIGGVAIDVGANIGILTVALARAVGRPGRVLAFEPVPANLEFLRWNIETNWLMDIVTVTEAAVSNRAGSTRMAVSDEWNSLGSIVQESIEYAPGHAAGSQRLLEVETIRLDDLLSEEHHIDLVKVDVEGAEDLVFEGMSSLLSKGVVARVAFECMREHMGDSWEGFMRRLKEFESDGWTFGIPGHDGSVTLLPVAAIAASGNFRCIVMERAGLRPAVKARRV